MSSVEIQLTYPIEVAGVKVNSVQMRRPTVNDLLVADKLGGSDGEKELATFANLCGIPPADLRKMDLKDYKRLQTAWAGFLD